MGLKMNLTIKIRNCLNSKNEIQSILIDDSKK